MRGIKGQILIPPTRTLSVEEFQREQAIKGIPLLSTKVLVKQVESENNKKDAPEYHAACVAELDARRKLRKLQIMEAKIETQE